MQEIHVLVTERSRETYFLGLAVGLLKMSPRSSCSLVRLLAEMFTSLSTILAAVGLLKISARSSCCCENFVSLMTSSLSSNMTALTPFDRGEKTVSFSSFRAGFSGFRADRGIPVADVFFSCFFKDEEDEVESPSFFFFEGRVLCSTISIRRSECGECGLLPSRSRESRSFKLLSSRRVVSTGERYLGDSV